MDNTDFICVDLNDDWCVKIVNNYNDFDYLTIKGNLRDISTIYTVEDIFTHLILPKDRIDQYGNLISWSIYDRENLYTINNLPQDLWSKSENPKCFESESESSYAYYDYNSNTRSYFDEMVENF